MLLDSLTGASTYISSTAYDSAGRIDLRILSSSRRTDYTYYPWAQQGGCLQNLQSGTSGTPNSLQDLTNAYDPAGNLLTITDSKAGGTQTHSFTYDALDRLTSASASGGSGGIYSESYSYDGNTGNLSFKTSIGSYTYDTNHKHAVASTSNGWSFGYDANGNMTQRTVNGQNYTLGYDAEGHLVSVSGTSLSAQFTYDGDGKRVKSIINDITTYFVGNYYEVSGSTVKKYYYAGGQRVAMRENGTLSYILSDHLGSTSLTTDQAGGNPLEQRYTAWGEVRYTSGTLPTRYQYTGQYSYTPEFGLYFYNARWYDPALGRFTSPDTIVPTQTQGTQAWDRYAYVNNNPVRYNDPTGHDTECGIGETCPEDPPPPDETCSYTDYYACGKDPVRTEAGWSPDYISLNLGGSNPGLGTVVSGQISVVVDRFGNLYLAPGLALGPEAPLGFSASLSPGYINSWENSVDPSQPEEGPPGEQRSEEILSQWYVNAMVCVGFCAGGTASLTKPYVGFELLGIGVPQFSVGGGYSFLIDLTPNSGVPLW